MSLSRKLHGELVRLIGFSSSTPRTVILKAPDGVVVEVDLTAVDSMSCAYTEVRINVPKLVGADFEKLKKWAEALSKRVTYLLEHIGPLEFDPDAQTVLIRSNPPSRQGNSTKYYEVLLQSHSGGNFTLRRYEAVQGAPGRTQVEIRTTHEVLDRLVNDLVETIPA